MFQVIPNLGARSPDTPTTGDSHHALQTAQCAGLWSLRVARFSNHTECHQNSGEDIGAGKPLLARAWELLLELE